MWFGKIEMFEAKSKKHLHIKVILPWLENYLFFILNKIIESLARNFNTSGKRDSPGSRTYKIRIHTTNTTSVMKIVFLIFCVDSWSLLSASGTSSGGAPGASTRGSYNTIGASQPNWSQLQGELRDRTTGALMVCK